MLWLRSTVRDVQTKPIRMMAPTRQNRRTLMLCDGKVRLQYGRPIAVSEVTVTKYSRQLQDMCRRGMIDIRVGNINGPQYQFGSTPPPDMPVAAPVVDIPEVDVQVEVAAEPDIPCDVVEPETTVDILESEPASEPEPPRTVPIERMSKSELIGYLRNRGDTSEELDSMTKRQLLARIEAL